MPPNFQILPIELNLQRCKWLLIPMYRPETYKKQDFIDSISHLLDYYANKYDNILLIGDINMEVDTAHMTPFLESYNLHSMIRTKTCFMSEQGSCIDLMLTNKKHSFMKTQTFDTNESDFHHMIYTMFKSTFVKAPPKLIKYRQFKSFNTNDFVRDLSYNLETITSGIYSTFEKAFQQVLDKHAPIKTKMVGGNDKPFVNRELRNAIATRSCPRNKAINRNNDLLNYKNNVTL